MKSSFSQKRAAALAFALVFSLVTAAVIAVSIWRPKEKKSYYENRDLATFPALSWEAVSEGKWFEDLETYLCDQAALRTTVLKLSAWADLKLFHRPVVNDIVVTGGPLLPYWAYETVDEAEIAARADTAGDDLAQLARLVESYGGTFLYVAVPNQYVYFADRYPAYLNNHMAYVEPAKGAFLAALDGRDIPYVDVGAGWQAEGNPEGYISYGDHHWTLEGCLSAYWQMMDALNERSGLALRVLEEEDLTVHTLSNPYLGSRARQMCGQLDTGEHITYAELAQPIPFERRDNGRESAPSLFAFPSNGWEAVPYTFFMGGDMAETILTTNRPELPSCLIYGDSYTNLMETFLYASFDETRSIDLRHYKEMSLLEYVDQYRPEVVVAVRDCGESLSLEYNGRVTEVTD